MRRLLRLCLLAAVATAGAGLPAQAEEFAMIVNRIVYPGETLGPDALEQVPLRRSGNIPGPIAMAPEDIEGKVARRTLLPGKLIPTASLREAFVVDAGSPVVVQFVHGGLSISATAVPLTSASVGDMIKLRNMDSGKVFTGIAMADGTVRVGQ